MKIRVKHICRAGGFTIVEMIAVIAIIAILVSLLIPALNIVRKTAGNVRQKSQFSSIELGLLTYRQDFGDYPQSDYIVEPQPADGEWYCGAQKLAEAMVGLDGFGCHRDSIFRSHGMNQPDGSGEQLYNSDTYGKRKGPYLELETANAVKLYDLYANTGDWLAPDTFVLADMFGMVRHRATQKKTGMPILYFRANTLKVGHDVSNPPNDNIYNVFNSAALVYLSPPWDGSKAHSPYFESDFYKNTWNENFTSPRRPYRTESFILLSAGADGLYGTADDIYNFEKE